MGYKVYQAGGILGKLLYVALFPAHWLILTIAKAALNDHRFVAIPAACLIWAFLYFTLRTTPNDENLIGLHIVMGIAVVSLFGSRNKNMSEKSKFFD